MLEQIGLDSSQIQRCEEILETEGIEEARKYLRCQKCEFLEKMYLYQKSQSIGLSYLLVKEGGRIV